jgi:hypothetical protein
MTDKIIKEAFQNNQEGFAEAFTDALEEVTETDAFASIISECMTENIEVNLDLPNGERLHVTPDVASVLSETHDNLPKEMQQSFREMVFESKDKYTKILETIVTGEEQ